MLFLFYSRVRWRPCSSTKVRATTPCDVWRLQAESWTFRRKNCGYSERQTPSSPPAHKTPDHLGWWFEEQYWIGFLAAQPSRWTSAQFVPVVRLVDTTLVDTSTSSFCFVQWAWTLSTSASSFTCTATWPFTVLRFRSRSGTLLGKMHSDVYGSRDAYSVLCISCPVHRSECARHLFWSKLWSSP